MTIKTADIFKTIISKPTQLNQNYTAPVPIHQSVLNMRYLEGIILLIDYFSWL